MTSPDTPPNTTGTGFTKKVAGLPMWGWVAIAGAAGVIVWVWWKSRGTAQSANNTNAQPVPTDTSGLATDQYSAIIAQLNAMQQNQNPPSPTPGPGVVLATRNDDPSNPMPLPYKASERSWNDIAQNHYTANGEQDIGGLGSELAHYNGRSGLSNPQNTTVVMPKKLVHVGG